MTKWPKALSQNTDQCVMILLYSMLLFPSIVKPSGDTIKPSGDQINRLMDLNKDQNLCSYTFQQYVAANKKLKMWKKDIYKQFF